MFKEIVVQRISAGTLFKLVGLGLLLTLVPFSIVVGILSFFGASTVTWNNQPLTGLSGLVASPFIGLFISGLFTMFLGACMALGLWLYSLIRPVTILAKLPTQDSA